MSIHTTTQEAEPLELAYLEREVAAGLAFPSEVSPRDAVRATMGALVERLTAGEAHALLAGLSPGLRPVFVELVLRREGRPVVPRDRVEFLLEIAERLSVTPACAEGIVRAVFDALRRRLPVKVVDGVAQQLPHGLKELWRGCSAPSAEPEGPSNPEDARRQVLADIDECGALPVGIVAAEAFEAVMCLFSQHVSGGEARDVLLSLPQSLRPLLARCLLHRGERAAVFDREAFLRAPGRALGNEPRSRRADRSGRVPGDQARLVAQRSRRRLQSTAGRPARPLAGVTASTAIGMSRASVSRCLFFASACLLHGGRERRQVPGRVESQAIEEEGGRSLHAALHARANVREDPRLVNARP